MLAETAKGIGAVVERIRSGDHAGAAEQFVETVALGPRKLGPGSAETMIFRGAGHIPHVTHPEMYVEATTAFIRKHEA